MENTVQERAISSQCVRDDVIENKLDVLGVLGGNHTQQCGDQDRNQKRRCQYHGVFDPREELMHDAEGWARVGRLPTLAHQIVSAT